MESSSRGGGGEEEGGFSATAFPVRRTDGRDHVGVGAQGRAEAPVDVLGLFAKNKGPGRRTLST